MTYRVRNIGIAIALALVAAFLVTFYVTNYKRTVQQGESNVRVYVAAHDIPANTAGVDIVKNRLLSPHDVARRTVVPGAISSPDQVARLVSNEPIYAGEQVSARRFSSVADRGIQSELRGAMRAIQVPGDPNQLLAGTLRTGDRVDLVASLKLGGNSDAHASRIVLRNLRVLRSPTDSVTAKISTGPGASSSALLAVTDTQVQKLFYVLKNADWSLELRPVLNASDSPENVETLNSVLHDGVRG